MQSEDAHHVLNGRQQFLFEKRQSIRRFWQCFARICKVFSRQAKWLLRQTIFCSLLGFFEAHVTDWSARSKPILFRHLHKICFLERLRFKLPRQLCFRPFGAKPTFVTIGTVLKFKLVQICVNFIDTMEKAMVRLSASAEFPYNCRTLFGSRGSGKLSPKIVSLLCNLASCDFFSGTLAGVGNT